MPCYIRMKGTFLQGLLWLYLLGFGYMALSLEPGFLDFDNLPDTNFSCVGKVIGGYYADMDTNCQMFHVCTIGQLDEPMDIRFLCLNGTVFDQETRVCERIDEVDCSKSEQFYSLNLELYGNSPPSNLEETAETEQPLIIKSTPPTTTTSTTTTTSRPPKIQTTRQQFFTTIVPTTTPKNAGRPQVITTHHFPVLNPSPDIRFNPEEINISLRPGGAPPDIRQKETTQRTLANYDRPTPSDVNFGFTFRQTDEIREDYTEAPDYHSGYRYREHRPGQGYLDHNPTRLHQQQQQQQQHYPAVTTFRTAEHHKTSPPSPAAAAGSFYLQQLLKPPQPHHRSQYEALKSQPQRQQGPQRLQLPVPLPPQLSQFTFSTPAPFQHTDAKRYTKGHVPPPRIVISASASVSDDTGRRLNYSLGTIGAAHILQHPSNSYEEYKDEEEGLERFYHDVQKVKHSRRKRSADRQIRHSDIIKNDQQAVQVLKFLFDWYRNEKTNPAKQSTTPVSTPLDASTIQLINGELAPTTEDAGLEIPDSFEDSDLFDIKSKYSIIGSGLRPPIKDATKDELYQHEHDYVDDNYEPVVYKEKKEHVKDNASKDKEVDKNVIHELVTKNESQKNHSVLLDYVDDNIEPIYYRERQDDKETEKLKQPSKKDTVDVSSDVVSSTYSALDDSYYKAGQREREHENIKETTVDTSSRNEPSIQSTLDQLYYIDRQDKEPSKKDATVDAPSQYESSTQSIQHQEEEGSKPSVQQIVVDPSSHHESSTFSALDRLYYLDKQDRNEQEQSIKKDTSENDWTHYESSTHSTLEQLLAANLQNTYDENSQTTSTESQPSTNFNLVTEETTISITDTQAIEYTSQNIQRESSPVDDNISNNFINQISNLSTSQISDTTTSSTTEKPALIVPKRNQRRGRRRYQTNDKNNKDVEFKNLLIEKLIERPYRAKDDYDYLRTVSNVYTTTLRTEDSLQDDEKQPTVPPVTEDGPTVSSEANTLNELFEPTSTPDIATTSPSTTTPSTTTTTVTASTSISNATPTLTSIITEAPRTRSSRRRGRHRFTVTEASTTPRNSKRRRRPTLETRATTEASTTTQTPEHSIRDSEETQYQNAISFEAIQRLFDINGDAQDSPIEPASEVVAVTTERYQDAYRTESSTSSPVGNIQISPTKNELNLETIGTPNFPVTESTAGLPNDKTVSEVTETVPPVEVYLTSFNPTTEATHITKKKQLKEEPTTPYTEWTSLERFISNIESNTRSVATDKEKIHKALGELNEGETDEKGGGAKDIFSVNLLPKMESVEQSSTTTEVTTGTVLEETTTEKFKYFYEMIPSILENVADDRKTTYFGESSTSSEDAVEGSSTHDIVETTTGMDLERLSDTTAGSIGEYTDSKVPSDNDGLQEHESGRKIILGIIQASAEPDSTTSDVENTTLTYQPETTTPIEVPVTKTDATSTVKSYTFHLETSTTPPTPRVLVELASTSKHLHDDSKTSDALHRFFDKDNFWEHLHTPVDFSPHNSQYADRFGHNYLDQNAGASFPSGKVSHSTESIRQIADEIANLTKSVLDLSSLSDTSSSLQSTTPESRSSQIPTTLDFTTQSPSTTTQEVTTEYSFRRNGRRRGQRPTNPRRNPESNQRHRHRFQSESFTSRPENRQTIEDDIVDLVAKTATETTLEPTKRRRPATRGGDFSTDAPLKKSAVPTQAERGGDSALPTTPLSETKMTVRKHYFFNCFGKPIDEFYADPRDCRLFHYCTQGYSKNQLLDMKFVCDLNTYYDDEKLICTKKKPARCL